MISLAWGGFTNGSVPDTATTVIDSAGHRLEHVAAAQFLAMQAALLAAVGRTISVAPGADSANRTLAQQQADYALYQQGGNVAAYPGTSNHGWARAVDITGYEGNTRWISPTTGNSYYVDLDVWEWLQAHAADYGFHWATGDASGEGWHWESYNTPSATAVASATASETVTPIEQDQEDDMFVAINKDTSVGALAAPGMFAGIPSDLSDELQAQLKVVKLTTAGFDFLSAACLAAARTPVRVYANTKTQQWVVGGAGIWYPIPAGDGGVWTNIFGPFVAVDDPTFLKLRKGFIGQ